MRYFEISSGLRLPISSEERELASLCHESPIGEKDLDERQAQLAHEMTVRGLLRRTEKDEENYYETDKMDLWRF